jgi:hypothetical protein
MAISPPNVNNVDLIDRILVASFIVICNIIQL